MSEENRPGENVDQKEASALKIDPHKEVVLVLEDSAPNRNILCAILKKLGFEVLSAENGVKGVNILRQCEEQNVKLIAVISDIMMPQMDGLEFLTHFKESEKFGKLPFVFVTAAADKENVIEAGRLGVKHYLLKPVSMEQIKNKLNEIFPEKKLGMIKIKKAV